MIKHELADSCGYQVMGQGPKISKIHHSLSTCAHKLLNGHARTQDHIAPEDVAPWGTISFHDDDDDDNKSVMLP